ncbi:MAG: FixH family protein [Phycisphaerales bacterium]|nr:FixH family protein [Phycisphaerales bacterium]
MTIPIAAPLRRRFFAWPMPVFLLIGLNVAIVAITIYAAASDPATATEPDYYAKALRFDQVIRQRETNSRLAWLLTPAFEGSPTGASVSLRIHLADQAGKPIPDALITSVCFANTRSAERQELTLSPIASSPGDYTAPIRITRPGLWQLRMSVLRGPDTFTHDTELLVPGFDR